MALTARQTVSHSNRSVDHSTVCSVERSELWNAHCCAFCARVNGADSAVRFASLRFGSLRFASVCSVNGVSVLSAEDVTRMCRVLCADYRQH